MNRHSQAILAGVLALGVAAGACSGGSQPEKAASTGPAKGEWRYQGADAGSTRYSPLDQVTAGQLRDAHRGVAVEPNRRRRPADRARDAELRRRQAVQRGRPESTRHLDGSDQRQAAVEFRRARDLSLQVFDEGRVRKGRGVSRDRREGRHLHHDARVFPLRPRRADRSAAPELGPPGQPGLVPEIGRRRSHRGFDPRLGAVGEPEEAVRPERGRAARARLHHVVVAADRRQRRRHRRQLRRAGLSPDAARERPWRHPRLRRADRKAPLEVPRDPAGG